MLLQNLEIKVQEPLDFGSVLSAQAIDVVEEAIKSGQEPLVELRPIGWKILFDKYACHKCELAVGSIAKNAVVWVLDQGQDFGFEVL